jgi:hypothetical protein
MQRVSTLFTLTLDEHGDFGDHAPPPVNVLAGDSLAHTETAFGGKNIARDLTRLAVAKLAGPQQLGRQRYTGRR